MVDIKILWPDAETPMHSTGAVAIVIDEGASTAIGQLADLHRALREFDDFVGRTPLVRKRIAFTLLAPQAFLSGLDLRHVLTEATPSSEASAKATVAAHFERLIYQDRSDTHGPIAKQAPPSWLVILSGGANNSDAQWPDVIGPLLKERAIILIPILVGSNDDEIFQSSFGASRPALRLQRAGASRLFAWLGKELVRVAGTQPDRRTALDVAGMGTWAQT